MILSQLIGLWKYKASLLSNISWTFQTQNWPFKRQAPKNGQKHTLFDHFVGLSLKGLKTLNHSISCHWLPSIHPDIKKHNVKEVFIVDFERLWDLLKTFCLACFSKIWNFNPWLHCMKRDQRPARDLCPPNDSLPKPNSRCFHLAFKTMIKPILQTDYWIENYYIGCKVRTPKNISKEIPL